MAYKFEVHNFAKYLTRSLVKVSKLDRFSDVDVRGDEETVFHTNIAILLAASDLFRTAMRDLEEKELSGTTAVIIIPDFDRESIAGMVAVLSRGEFVSASKEQCSRVCELLDLVRVDLDSVQVRDCDSVETISDSETSGKVNGASEPAAAEGTEEGDKNESGVKNSEDIDDDDDDQPSTSMKVIPILEMSTDFLSKGTTSCKSKKSKITVRAPEDISKQHDESEPKEASAEENGHESCEAAAGEDPLKDDEESYLFQSGLWSNLGLEFGASASTTESNEATEDEDRKDCGDYIATINGGAICKFCGKEFSAVISCKRHVTVIHSTEEKPFTCHLCSYASKRKVHLEAHLITHGYQDYVRCHVCNFYGRWSALLGHVSRRHPEHDFSNCALCIQRSTEREPSTNTLPSIVNGKEIKPAAAAKAAALRQAALAAGNSGGDDDRKPLEMFDLDFSDTLAQAMGFALDNATAANETDGVFEMPSLSLVEQINEQLEQAAAAPPPPPPQPIKPTPVHRAPAPLKPHWRDPLGAGANRVPPARRRLHSDSAPVPVATPVRRQQQRSVVEKLSANGATLSTTLRGGSGG